MTDERDASDTPFRLEEATIEQLHRAIRAGQTNCVAVVQHYIERARAYNGVASVLVTEDGAAIPEARGAVRALAPLRFPTATVRASSILPDIDKYRGKPLEFGRMEATASDPSVQQQYGMIAGIPDGRPTERAGHAQHPWRAVGHLPRRVRPSSVAGTVAARCAAGVRDVPPIARRARTRRRTRLALRAEARPRRHADVRRRVLVQGPVRHQGHAHHRRRRRALRHRFPGARSCAGRAVAQQGRDHLRQGGQHRIQRTRRRSRRPAQPGQGAAVGVGLSAQQLGRQPRQPVRHDARGLARLEFGIGRVGQRKSGDVQSRRGNPRLVPRPGQPQRGGADPAAQGDARLRRRGHRRRHLLRPQRHPRPHDRRLRQGARRAQGPGRGLLRSARSLHDGAPLVGIADALRQSRDQPRRSGRAQRCAHWHRPRVDAGTPW